MARKRVRARPHRNRNGYRALYTLTVARGMGPNAAGYVIMINRFRVEISERIRSVLIRRAGVKTQKNYDRESRHLSAC